MLSGDNQGHSIRRLGATILRLVTVGYIVTMTRSSGVVEGFSLPSSATTSSSRTSSMHSSSSPLGENINDMDISNIKAAVLVPGFLTGGAEFQELCDLLTYEYSIPTIAVPMPNWHWIPCLGGRSARPMLERIDFTVKHLLANDGDITKVPKQFDYTLQDCWNDFQSNPGGVMKVGGSSKVKEYPTNIEPHGTFLLPEPTSLQNKKIALIGHSAGGWMSRAYLSSRNYGGKAYSGSKYVHSLITLGTPHVTAPNAAFEGIEWCNEEDHSLLGVPTLTVGGTGYLGDQYGGLTQGAYKFCCPDGTDGTTYDGDGVTPIFSSTGLIGAEKLQIEDVNHFNWSDIFGGDFASPELSAAYKQGRPWYGSRSVVDQWIPFIEKQSTVDASNGAKRSTSTGSNKYFFIKQ